MSVMLAPYHTAMRIGQGFNSYTHECLINDAVIFDDEAPGGDHYQGDTKQVSQVVTYCTRHVDKISDVTDAMNISAALSIKSATAGGGLSGSYVDSDKFKESAINYFVQVQVVNQTVMAEDVRKFNAIHGVSDTQSFMKVYGDCYISGFIEGGELDALISIKSKDQSKITDIKASLEANFGKGGVGGSLSGSFGMNKDNASSDTETTITVNWNGGGDIKDANELWSIDSLTKVAAAFPNNVAKCPQRTYAILTKYENLRSFQLMQPKPSVLDYDIASLYTNDLLDCMMAYKNIWKQIHIMTSDYDLDKITLTKVDTSKKAIPKQPAHKHGDKKQERNHFLEDLIQIARDHTDDSSEQVLGMVKLLHSSGGSHASSQDMDYPDNAGVPYEADDLGLEKARRDCRLEMLKIVKEVDAVIADPSLALDPQRDAGYMIPSIFRKLLPQTAPKPPPGTTTVVSTTTTPPAPVLPPQPMYTSAIDIPPHFKDWYNSVKDTPKAAKFNMAPCGGDQNKVGPGGPIKDFDDVTNDQIVTSVEVWTKAAKDHQYIQAYRLTFNKGNPIYRHHQGINGTPPGTTADTWQVPKGERIMATQITAGKFEFDAKVVSRIKFVTDKKTVKVLGYANDVPQQDSIWTEAPHPNYSFKGFWAETGEAFDRLGCFYGLDE